MKQVTPLPGLTRGEIKNKKGVTVSTYCGVDFHARQQLKKWCDTADGEIRERGYSLSIKSAASQE